MIKSVEQLVDDLYDPDLREAALFELSEWRKDYPDLGPLLCRTPGIVAILLQEIISFYPHLSPPNLTPEIHRAGSAVELVHRLALHPDSRNLVLNAKIHTYVYSFLETTHESIHFERLRLASLGVIAALIKDMDEEAIRSHLESDIVTWSLRSMEFGSASSQARILRYDVGLDYICRKPERIFAVVGVLGIMVCGLAEQPSLPPLPQIIRCYFRLSCNPSSCAVLRNSLPHMLRDATFTSCLHQDPTTGMCLQQMLLNVQGPYVVTMPAGGGFGYMMFN